MKKEDVYMGKMEPSWGGNKHIKYITFSVTDECNLRCTYCYFTHKTHKNVMSFEVAKAAVDDILSNDEYLQFDGVVWDFIGGEPTIEMELIDQISDYIVYKMYKGNHKWLSCYHFMLGTNGLLYDSSPMQQYIKKHGTNLYVALTIDGSKEKHDLSRIKKDGSGSYDDVARILPLWKKQFGGNGTKSTFSHNDLPYLKDSIIHLWNLGIKNIAANVVFEDVWKLGDVDIYRDQLYQLANYVIENDLWYDYSVRFFDPVVGTPRSEKEMRGNQCGTGTMMAISTSGDYYPCVRFMPSAMTKNSFGKIGDIHSGVEPDKLRGFAALTTYNQSPQKCLDCTISGGCSWCSGFNYDASSIGTIFERQTFLCELHKANVEVNKYLWRQYELRKGKISPHRYQKMTTLSKRNRYLYIYSNSHFPSICGYYNHSKHIYNMDDKLLEKAFNYCEDNNYVPVFCGFKNLPNNYYGYQIITYKDYISKEDRIHDSCIPQLLITEEELTKELSIPNLIKNFIVHCEKDRLSCLIEKLHYIYGDNHNVNLNIMITENQCDVTPEHFVSEYDKFLCELKNIIISEWKNKNYININILTNELFANNNRYCGAGESSLFLSPDGNFYLCSAFYNQNQGGIIGNIEEGINNIYQNSCNMDSAPLCKDCNIRHCSRCIFKNKTKTGEISIPSEEQCVTSYLEYKYSKELAKEITDNNIFLPFEINKKLSYIAYPDPLEKTRGSGYMSRHLNTLVNKMEK